MGSVVDSVSSIFGGGSGGSQAAPDADPSIKAAQDNITGNSGYGWDTFKNTLFPQQQTTANTANANAANQYGLQSGIATTQNNNANTAYAQANDTMTPALQALKTDANNYNEAGYREQMAGKALGDINTQFENQRNQTAMRNQAYGIDPTSGVAQGTQNANSVMQAAAGAAAMNQTRQAAYDLGLQKQQNLYNMGTGMVGMGNTATGLGLQASNSALTASQLPMANQTALGNNLNSAIQTNTAANSASGNLGLGKYQTQVGAVNAANQANATEAAGLGSAIGAGIGAFGALGGPATLAASDIAVKQDVIRVGKLDNGISLYSYQYKPEFRDSWGHGPQIGVLAHEVEHIPGAVMLHADGYKVVNYSKVTQHKAAV